MRAPRETCRRCGGPNFVWFAPSPLWNLVMRENDINGPIKYDDLVCVGCFMDLAAQAGIEGKWRLTIDPEPDGLVYTTPSGRVWNPETWLWEEPAQTPGQVVADMLMGEVDDEEFCPRCFAGMESSQHFEQCERPAREREEAERVSPA